MEIKNSIRVLYLLQILLVFASSTSFDCSRFSFDLMDDNRALTEVTKALIEESKNKPILMRPPFQWAQNLHFIFIEVKYSYRHDVSGCATLTNETLNATNNKIYISAYCKDMDNYLFFEVSFPFWGEVNATTLK